MTVLRAPSGKYRKVLALAGGGTLSVIRSDDYDAGREGKCARTTGHTLTVVISGGPGGHTRIECRSCGATWRDEGF